MWITRVSIANPVFAVMVMVALCVLGLLATGTVGGSATGGLWSSSGTGTFAPNATTLNAIYSLSAADFSAGVVTLTLHATGQLPPCVATANVVVTAQLGFVNAGVDMTI